MYKQLILQLSAGDGRADDTAISATVVAAPGSVTAQASACGEKPAQEVTAALSVACTSGSYAAANGTAPARWGRNPEIDADAFDSAAQLEWVSASVETPYGIVRR